MGEEEPGSDETQLDSEMFASPLRMLAIESTELSVELLRAGMPDGLVAQIISNMLSDAILYRIEYDGDDDDDDEEDNTLDDGAVD